MKTNELTKKIKALSKTDLQRLYSITFPTSKDIEDKETIEMIESLSLFNGCDIFSNDFDHLQTHLQNQQEKDLIFFAEFYQLDSSQPIESLRKDIYQFLCSPSQFNSNKKHQRNNDSSESKESKESQQMKKERKEKKKRKDKKDGKEEHLTKKEQKERSIISKLKTSTDDAFEEMIKLRQYIEKKLHYEMSLPSKRIINDENEDEKNENDAKRYQRICLQQYQKNKSKSLSVEIDENNLELEKPTKTKSLKESLQNENVSNQQTSSNETNDTKTSNENDSNETNDSNNSLLSIYSKYSNSNNSSEWNLLSDEDEEEEIDYDDETEFELF